MNSLPFDTPRVTTADILAPTLESLLGNCPSQVYLLVNQPGVAAADFHGGSSTAAPALRGWVEGWSDDKTVRSGAAVADVQGALTPTMLTGMLERQCGAQVGSSCTC